MAIRLLSSENITGNISVSGTATFTGNITGVGASFIGTAASGAPLVTIENNSGSTATSYGLLVKGGGNSSSGKTFEVRDDSGNTDLIVKGNGNVGIATATPQKKFHIEGTGGASEMQILVSSASDTVGHTAGIGLRGEGGEADGDLRIKGGIFFERIAGSFGNGKMILAVNSSVSNTSVTVADHALTIDTNKNVGIGTDNPGTKLEIVTGVGDDAIRLNFGQSADIFLGFNAANPRILLQDNSNVVTHNFQSNGDNYIKGSNVGIGTGSPLSKFEVYGGNSGVNDVDRYVRFKASNGEKRFDFHIGGTGNASRLSMFAADGTTEGARISSSGDSWLINNLGIGTASPSKKLHVVESDSATYAVEIENTLAGGDYMVMIGDAGDNVFEFDSSGTGGEALMKMYSDGVLKAQIAADGNSYFNGGNVGIGNTSPTLGKLQVSGIGYFGPVGTGNATTKPTMQSNAVLRLKPHDNNSTNMNFAQVNDGGGIGIQVTNGPGTSNWDIALSPFGGNVGIGTPSPSERLSVDGNAEILKGDDARVYIKDIGDSSTILLRSDGANTSIGTDSNHDLQIQTNGSTKMYIESGGNVGIGTTNPSSELEVAGRAIVEKLEVARYSDPNAPAAVYVGRLANPMGAGGVFRLGAIESSSTVNKIDEPFLITYSSGHWGCQPMFFAEFTVTYYRGSYIKYWAQHEVSGSRLEIVDGPYGGQIITGGAPVSRTMTTLCNNCHGGQPVYKCVWKWSNSGTYIKTSPIVSLVEGHGSARVYTSGSSSESAIDTLLGSAGSPGPAYLLMGINNAQAAGFTGLQTQN